MENATPIPAKITVTGGGLVLKNISTIFTEKIPLDKLIESGIVTASLILDPPSIKFEGDQKVQIQCLISNKPVQ